MKNYVSIMYIALLAMLVTSCASNMSPDIERGSSYDFRPGYPEVRLSAIGVIDENDKSQIKIAADIIYGSLVFKNVNDERVAKLSIDIQIVANNETQNIIESQQYPLTLTLDPDRQNISQDAFTLEKDIEVPPGDYNVNVSVTDLNSQKQTVRTATTIIPDPEEPVTNLTNIRLLNKDIEVDSENFLVVTTYDVTKDADSLKFVFQVTNNKPDEPITINSRLIRFKSDTSIARPMTHNNYTQSSLQYKGIEYDEQEIIQETRRTLLQPGSVLVEFIYAALPRGNYRFEVETEENENDEEQETLYKARDFGVKSTNYPALKTPYELARPLYYLMSEKDHKKLMSIKSPDSLKKAIDRFWLENVKDPLIAKRTLSMYYERVEEANKQFSNFKEGWKTDTGMMYILFGPPWYVETRLNEMFWSYSYDRTDFEFNFFFEAPKFNNKFFPFDNYLLQRSFSYHSIQYRQIQLWLSGGILTDNL